MRSKRSLKLPVLDVCNTGQSWKVSKTYIEDLEIYHWSKIPFLIEFETFYIVGANSLNLVLATRAKTFYN